MWTPAEKKFLKSLNTPHKIQRYLDDLIYNPDNSACSPRYVMMTGDGHCFEGGLLAAAALELQGHRPLMVDLVAHNDDHHVLAVYKTKTGWGSISKSNTTLLRGREPFHKSIRELVMSYFPFYFNTKGHLSLEAYSAPINLNRFNHWNWRTSDEDLEEMGMSFNDLPHFTIASKRTLTKLPKVKDQLLEACFLGADQNGLYQA
ncbi:hypothetical protein [Peredibacter starrii]|uniref:Uncharacterized protein n=1 Tax=Peredibacter starrii TaxID=28202 RepID=A0AAX4HVN9_9BACT|nr:hypothetical protein [Peredibacter starrii]WPU67044.1 hypothetical protein SOO65_09795 [Peredibacter starrii]